MEQDRPYCPSSILGPWRSPPTQPQLRLRTRCHQCKTMRFKSIRCTRQEWQVPKGVAMPSFMKRVLAVRLTRLRCLAKGDAEGASAAGADDPEAASSILEDGSLRLRALKESCREFAASWAVDCNNYFCERCLANRYNVKLSAELHTTGWMCPVCMNSCNCAHCLRLRESTGKCYPRRAWGTLVRLSEAAGEGGDGDKDGGKTSTAATPRSSARARRRPQVEEADSDGESSDAPAKRRQTSAPKLMRRSSRVAANSGESEGPHVALEESFWGAGTPLPSSHSQYTPAIPWSVLNGRYPHDLSPHVRPTRPRLALIGLRRQFCAVINPGPGLKHERADLPPPPAKDPMKAVARGYRLAECLRESDGALNAQLLAGGSLMLVMDAEEALRQVKTRDEAVTTAHPDGEAATGEVGV